MNYKKIYCDRWTAACTGNTVTDGDGTVSELRWKNIALGTLTRGPSGTVFTRLYRFIGDPECTGMSTFPGAEEEFGILLKNVETLEYICQLYDTVEPEYQCIGLRHGGELFGRILFHGFLVRFQANTGNLWQETDDPEKMVAYSRRLNERGRELETFDDMKLIGKLGNMLKR
jgi:hypothetical protein